NLENVNDQAFSKGLLGKGVAILPQENVVRSPIDGKLSVVFPTGHAYGITGKDGIEILIHIGIDTVGLKGEGFEILVKQGQDIKQGDPLVKCDFNFIEEKGYQTDVLVITTNSDQFSFEQLTVEGEHVDSLQSVIYRYGKKDE
ncbi:MAG: PTS glucose transporter subunit IIA, partial [Anaerorhabdus sp.]